MKKFEKHIKDIAQHIGLTPDERQLMKSNLEEYMAYKPVRRDTQTAHVRVVTTTWSYRAVGAFLIVTLLFTSGVGVTYASEDALPGEYLYPVKEVQEEVRTQFIQDEEKKAQWLIERAHRRLEEAQLLSQKGLLDDDTAALVEERFIKHTNRVRARIEHLREHRPALAEALELSFETGAEAHVETLETEDVEETTMVETAVTAGDVASFAAAPVVEKSAMRKMPKEHRRRIARLVRTHVGLAMPPIDVAGETTMTARVPETALNAVLTDPAVAEELVRVLTTQQQRLQERIETLPEEKQERLEEVLQEVRLEREEIVQDIADGDYQEAREKLRDVIKATHKTRSQVKIGSDIAPVRTLEEREALREKRQQLKQENVRPLPLRTKEEIRTRPPRSDRPL